MGVNRHVTAKQQGERGVSAFIIAVAMVFILGMAGLAIDLASLYVARNQAQRAADAAALAGAQAFVDNLCASGTGSTISGPCVQVAEERAQAIGNQNLIAGESPNIKLDSDIKIVSYSTSDPQIEVIAGRGMYGLQSVTPHGNYLPTFFIKIFGINQASVSATATAEAFNPTGTSQTMGTTCLKPWMFPNCDQFNNTVTNNPYCANGVGPFITSDNQIARPLDYPNGAIGEPYVIKPGSPGSAAAPGQYFIVYLPTDTAIPSQCPSCAKPATSGGNGSGAVYRANIECCNANTIYCGETITLNTQLQTTPGGKAGPTTDGVECLIHQNVDPVTGTDNSGDNCGQDFIPGTALGGGYCGNPPDGDASKLPVLNPFPPSIMPGPNNPFTPNGSQPLSYADSNSVVVAPIFNGIVESGQNTVQVAGFVQLFIRDVDPNGGPSTPKGTTYAYVLGISACGSGGSGPSPGTGGSGTPVATGSFVPVRLIHQ